MTFSARRLSGGRVKRLAIPVYRSRVSPVLDACKRLLLVDLLDGREKTRNEIWVAAASLIERVEILRRRQVDVLICAGISQQMYDILRTADIELISGIVGDIEQIIIGYADGRLDHPSFRMPGVDKGGGPGR